MSSTSPSASLILREPQLRVQINQIDYSLEPSGELDYSRLPRCPVIRIYGYSSLGDIACVHIHQVYPYFYIDFKGILTPEHGGFSLKINDFLIAVDKYTETLAHSLNHAIALSLKRNPDSPRSQYIRAIVLVKGVHFYGFHFRNSPFLKIYLTDPSIVSRAVTILQSGSVMETHFRTYESHLGFILQFMCDFNLYGCGWIDIGEVYLRGAEFEDQERPRRANFLVSPYYCQSRQRLEVDVIAPCILNRKQVVPRELHHKLEIPAPSVSNEPIILSVRELWEDERKRRLAQGLDPSPEIPVDPSESSRSSGGGWVMEERWQEELNNRLKREQEAGSCDYSTLQDWESWTMTSFESTEALWEEQYRQRGKDGKGKEIEDGVEGEVRVDVRLLSSQEMTELLQNEEKEEQEQEQEQEEELEGGSEEEMDGDEVQDGEVSPDESGDKDPALSPENPFLDQRLTNRNRHRDNSPELSDVNSRPFKRRKVQITQSHTSDNEHLSSQHKPDAAYYRVSCLRHHTYTAIKSLNLNKYEYSVAPPSTSELLQSIESYRLPYMVYRDPYYSNASDVPNKPRTYAGLVYRLKGPVDLDEWIKTSDWNQLSDVVSCGGSRLDTYGLGGWEYASLPPSIKQINKWLLSHEARANTNRRRRHRSQIEGPTLANIYGLTSSQGTHHQTIRGDRLMSIFSLEVFAPSQGNNVPDPEKDQIVAAFYAYQTSEAVTPKNGVVIVKHGNAEGSGSGSVQFEEVPSERDLLCRLTDIVNELDPDIIVGWEVQRGSWGYFDARARQHGFDLSDLISRAPIRSRGAFSDQWGARNTSTVKVAGRHVLNAWRIIRSEQSLSSYTLENAAFHILHKRLPHYNYSTLTKWYKNAIPVHIASIIRYFSSRTLVVLDILSHIELVTKTAEFARVFGVDFFSVISRGSQFKVESFMFRIAKPENLILLSPSKRDVGKQNAAECMPLIMEPMSAFYTSPLLVLDFQSLYPSVMIAYNYCYSTCLGRIADYKGRNKFGVTTLEQPLGLLDRVKEYINIAPNGVIYVKPEIRRGLLSRMLVELLETRVMVKQAMKFAKGNKALLQVLNARQLSLKYICNVTYGYTSATFSGRMPAVEIADSIVQTGRETLEKAITVINSTKKWGAQVVYGDTDSVFVYLPGKTREQAFRIGNDIADTITRLNPSPIKLKFEKEGSSSTVYHPCVLMAKKRYVGFKYENADEIEPVFDAKGIETVRRDGIPAQRKMTENCLKILFRTQDLTQIKDYCYQSWAKLMENRVSVQDFIFAKEVRMGTYSERGPPPPGVMVAARRMVLDSNNEPQYGERVPYVIVRGSPGSRLVERAMDPLEFVRDSKSCLDATYYITRVLIPPLERVLNLVGADVRQWYNDMPKPSSVNPMMSPKKFRTIIPGSPSKMSISEHFHNVPCISCSAWANEDGLCDECQSAPQQTIANLGSQLQVEEERLKNLHLVCASCTTTAPGEPVECDSIDCPWFFARKKNEERMKSLLVNEETKGEIVRSVDW
ncbi:hypothetical protein AMATHDRAFT_134471 [Amanita thiersii Skay4041]|uniref:DNA polymerase n=1 Tax=Amanita thiersii Skay4041 TaxID=703135 RepID=A0A2A9NY54_9AGAR|nr:hypothetical protein AMATHDRAFT_134471 [Amanita thiersii Skay4041]